MSFSRQVLVGLGLGLATGLFFGDEVSWLEMPADVFVRLLQMTVLPYVTLSLVGNLGRFSYADARSVGVGVGVAMVSIWVIALTCVLLWPIALPVVERAGFFSPSMASQREALGIVDLYVPSNPFHALANGVVPAVVLFCVFIGTALIGVTGKETLLGVIDTAADAVGRVARTIVKLTPYGIFAIAAHAAGTLDLEAVQRIQVYLVGYASLALLLAFWMIPGLVSVLTPIDGHKALRTSRDALLTAFLVGDLFIVLPALMASSSQLLREHLGDADGDVEDLPRSIVPVAFTFPHAGKLLSLSFIAFAAWYADVSLPVTSYPLLAFSGLVTLFGSLNIAVPFLLDLFRIPADAFQLFLATSVVNARFGTLVAAVHTLAVALIGSTVIAGRLQVRRGALVRYLATTAVVGVGLLAGLRVIFGAFVTERIDGRAVLDGMRPLATATTRDAGVLATTDIPLSERPLVDGVLAGIRQRGELRVGLIADGIPYAFRNKSGEVVGFDIEMAQRLAQDLGVRTRFVRFAQPELNAEVAARSVDIVMTGARLTPERASAFATSQPYLDETLAFITVDHRRGEFRRWEDVAARHDMVLGVQNLPYYIDVVRSLLPRARLEVIPETTELINPAVHVDAYVLPAERGSVLTLLRPEFSVVIPDGQRVTMPLAYPIAGQDPSWIRYVDAWIAMKRRDGFIDRLYAHWILGKGAVPARPRWSIKRDILGWGRAGNAPTGQDRAPAAPAGATS